jgi:magnesium-transporting ATPase (P-type)
VLKYQQPSKSIFEFEASLKIDTDTKEVQLDQFLYKGAKLKNSGEVYALVCYTGSESKQMLNSGRYHFKMSRMEKVINYCILFNIGVMFMLSAIFCVEHHHWIVDNREFLSYIYPIGESIDYAETAFLKYLTFFLVLNNMVPLAMVVWQEINKLHFAAFVEWDVEMVSKNGLRKCEVHNSAIHEDLGQINYMFCDKTGTLTKNQLKFEGVSLMGQEIVCSPQELEK